MDCLANTGFDTVIPVIAAVVMLVAGGVALMLVRRGRRGGAMLALLPLALGALLVTGAPTPVFANAGGSCSTPVAAPTSPPAPTPTPTPSCAPGTWADLQDVGWQTTDEVVVADLSDASAAQLAAVAALPSSAGVSSTGRLVLTSDGDTAGPVSVVTSETGVTPADYWVGLDSAQNSVAWVNFGTIQTLRAAYEFDHTEFTMALEVTYSFIECGEEQSFTLTVVGPAELGFPLDDAPIG